VHKKYTKITPQSQYTLCSTPVIPNLGYAYPQVYKPGHLGVRENN